MDLKILMVILLYWGIFLTIFTASGGIFLADEGYSVSANMNTTSLNANETGTGGLFASGISFGRFFGFTLFGIGLPTSVPVAVRGIIILWQSIWTFFSVGFVISSIWNG